MVIRHVSQILALSVAVSAMTPATVVRTIPLPPESVVSIESTVGDVDIRGWERRELAIEIDAPDGIVPQIVEGPSSVRIAAVQADGGMNRSLKTRIAVRAPSAAVFEAVRLLDGRLTLEGLTGAVNADVRQGSIEASRVAGRLRLETGFGDVKVERAKLDADGLVRLRAFNGGVRLVFAETPTDARILALTFNGRIHSEIPLTRRERFGPRFGEATLGSGRPVVSIDTITGDIVIASAAGAPPR